jgi:hypothetical protein
VPKRRDQSKSEEIRFRVTPETKERMRTLQKKSYLKDHDEIVFAAYILDIGLDRYGAVILPAEKAAREDTKAEGPHRKVAGQN